MQLTIPEIKAKEMHYYLNLLNNDKDTALRRVLVRIRAKQFNLKLVKKDKYILEEND